MNQRTPFWHSRLAQAGLAVVAISSAVGLTYLWPQRNGLSSPRAGSGIPTTGPATG